jgi:ribosomal protein S24E
MSMIETVSDVENSFLSRREITCNFQGLGGKLKRKEAIEMITKEFNLSNKTVIAINMKNQTGRPNVTGMFYVYESEELAKKQVNPTIFQRLERQAKKEAEAAPAEEKEAEAAPAEEKEAEAAPAEEKVAEAAPAEEKVAEAAPAEEKVAEAAPAEEEEKK